MTKTPLLLVPGLLCSPRPFAPQTAGPVAGLMPAGPLALAGLLRRWLA